MQIADGYDRDVQHVTYAKIFSGLQIYWMLVDKIQYGNDWQTDRQCMHIGVSIMLMRFHYVNSEH